MQSEDSARRAGGAVVTRADPAEPVKQPNLDAIAPSATNPDSKPASTAPEPLPESVKAAHRRKMAKATANQAGAQTQLDRSTSKPASTVAETCPEPARLVELEAIRESEARMLVSRIRDHINDARALVLELYEREGWRALGYNSWRECVVAEFDQSQAYLYRLLNAAQVEKNISPIGETVIAESVLRPLASLEPDQQREAWKMATEATPTPTAKEVARVAASLGNRENKPPARANQKRDEPPEYCEVGWILVTTERDLLLLALTAENEKWEESGLKFFESLRKRKIVTIL